jgi:hypothetical protein
MKYKLLNKGGVHFVCLEDGTNIPCQVSASLQVMKEKCEVRVVALCDERLGANDDPKLRLVDRVLTYGRYVLDDISGVVLECGEHGPEGAMSKVFFTVVCDLPNTIEQPKPYEE